MIVLSTARLYLRDFESADAVALADHFSGLGIDASNVAGLAAAARRTSRDGFRADFQLAVLESATNLLVGTCGLHLVEVEPREGWVSYSIVPAKRGLGYATEAAGAAVDFAFDRLEVERLRATCDPANAASLRVLRRLGFWREGIMNEPSLDSPFGRVRWLYGIRRRDWLRLER